MHIFAIKNRQYQFNLGKEIIASADYQNDLSPTLSCEIKWNLHIDKVCAKAMNVFLMIKRNLSDFLSAAKLNLYKSMFVPILIYGSPCNGMNKHVLTELEHVQKRVVNWALFGNESYKDKLRSLCLSHRFPCIYRSIISSYSRNSSVVDTVQTN